MRAFWAMFLTDPLSRLAAVLFVVAVCLASGCARQVTQRDAASLVPLRITPATTIITEPLLPDGLPDYVGSVNSRYHGVTPANNAAVPLLRAMNPKQALQEAARERTCELLGMVQPPDDGEFFQEYPNHKGSYTSALTGPWRAADYPELAEWLKGNEVPLGCFLEASRRERYWIPLATPDGAGRMIDVIGPNMRVFLDFGNTVIIRANLAHGEGRIDDAWTDLLACHRLSVLLGQGPTMLERMVGIGLGAGADAAIDKLAASGQLTPEQAHRIVRDLQSLPPGSTIASAMETDHFLLLDFLCHTAKGRDSIRSAIAGDDRLANVSELDLILNVDFNQVLERSNQLHAELVEGMSSTSYAEMTEAGRTFDESLEKMRKRSEKLPSRRQLSKMSPDAKTAWFSDCVLGRLMPAYSPVDVEKSARRKLMLRDMAMVTVALNGYCAETGGYPESLDALVPAWLAKVPVDFFSGQPLAYKPTEHGYVVYCFGNNGRDDGGKTQKDGGDADDIAFTASR